MAVICQWQRVPRQPDALGQIEGQGALCPVSALHATAILSLRMSVEASARQRTRP